jgi:hypothetical protein
MVPINWQPDRKTLREFAAAGMILLGTVAAPAAYYRGQTRPAIALWSIALILPVVGLFRPAWLKPIFIGLTLATWPIGWVVSKLTLALLYFLVFSPLAIFFRMVGRDALQRKFEPEATTYWEPYQPNRGLDRYLDPF